MNKIRKNLKKITLPLLFAAFVFFSMLFTILLMYIAIFALSHIGIISRFRRNYLFPPFLLSIICLIVGSVIAVIFSRVPLRSLRKIMDAADKIAQGDYSVRLNMKGPGKFQDLSRKFNHMAEELGSVEILRTDFVNNFSHEFKTPIVSIRGFAKMLKRDDITPEEQNEYLDIIIDESERLAELSTNILNLSKIEQQSILTGQKCFNISEQIRLVIAMMEEKWHEKQLDISFDCEEISFFGNEEMLKQVWINLLDNAVKFSPNKSRVEIAIQHTKNLLFVSFTNQGKPFSDEAAAHIFDKFYQTDKAHSTKGSGLGLAIAKRIVELHRGTISTSYRNDKITFTVKLYS